jgi:flagellar hook-associated protein 2
MTFNFNNVTQEGSQILFSGISSGIDSQSTIEAILAAKRAPAVLIEQKIETNNQKLADFNLLKDLSNNFKETLELLRAPVSSGSTDIFDQKLAFTTSQPTATAPGGHTPSDADSILGVSVTDDAVEGTHTVEVVQLATAHQIRSDAFVDTTTDLTTLGYTAGDFDINGQTVTLSAGDTLLDLQDKINALNAGATPTNVSASIITVSATEHYLTLTSTETGLANTITIGGTQAVHNSLGLTNVGTNNIKTELVAADDSIIRVDNLGVDIQRSSNTIDDVLEGITLNLFKAEADTEIKIDVESDVNAIKSTITNFIDAYNALRAFITDQRSEVVRVEGEEAEFGSLAFDTTLRRISDKLAELAVTNVAGIDPASGFASISQIGIEMSNSFELEMDEDVFDNALLTNPDAVRKLFVFDFSSSDSRVFHYKHTGSTENQVDGGGVVTPYYLNLGGTDGSGNIISGNFSDTVGAGTGNDPNLSIDGNLVEVNAPSGAEGLQLLYIGDPGDPAIADIEISFTRGVADTLFSFFEEVVGDTDAAIESAITTVQDQNVDYNQDIIDIDARLEITRKNLNARFLAMEVAMSRLNSLRDTLEQYSASLNSGSNN